MTLSEIKRNDPTWYSNTHCLALDGVRGFAILAVTLYRLCKELDPSSHPVISAIRRLAPMGERGVDLFFVLSGFLITGILLHSKESLTTFATSWCDAHCEFFRCTFSVLSSGC